MIVPVDADVEKAQHVAQEHGKYRLQRLEVDAVWHFQLQNHNRDDDGQHSVAKRFQPVLFHAAMLAEDLLSSQSPPRRYVVWRGRLLSSQIFHNLLTVAFPVTPSKELSGNADGAPVWSLDRNRPPILR